MTKRKKIRRNSGRYVPKYAEHVPVEVREDLDIEEHRTLWDDWSDYRDGQRDRRERNYYKRRAK